MQPDPIGYGGGLNLYTYVKNNPVDATDSFGKVAKGQDDVKGFGEDPVDLLCGDKKGIWERACEITWRCLMSWGSQKRYACGTAKRTCEVKCAEEYADDPSDKLTDCFGICELHWSLCVL